MANNEAVHSGAVDQVIKRPSVQFVNVPPTKEDGPQVPQRQGSLTKPTSVTKDPTGSMINTFRLWILAIYQV